MSGRSGRDVAVTGVKETRFLAEPRKDMRGKGAALRVTFGEFGGTGGSRIARTSGLSHRIYNGRPQGACFISPHP